MGAFNIETCARSNILKLEPYRCARDDYKDDGTNVLLDANENAFGPSLALSSDGQLLTNGDAQAAASSTSSTANGSNKHSSSFSSSSSSPVDLLGLNRYPDPHQIELKQLFCNLRNSAVGAHSSKPLTPENFFVGAGSDEAIDAILRSFCVPGRDKLLTCPPTYGMYSVSASINDVTIVKVPLDTTPGPPSSISLEGFQLRPKAINAALSADPSIKVIYITSPGNPTGNMVRKADVRAVLEHPTWNGVVVVDEAYIDFADDAHNENGDGAASLATWVPEWPNLIVLQTMSKAFGLAGIRVGVAIADPAIARLFNSLKAPYNVASPSSALAIQALQPNGGLAVMRKYRQSIIEQRDRLVRELPHIPGVGRLRGGKEANFLLVEMQNAGGQPSNEVALAVYERLAEQKGVVVRFRGKEEGCPGCLRITIGTEPETSTFLQNLEIVLSDIAKGRGSVRRVNGAQEQKDEIKANNVVA